jgi:SAM-dependent methyltransferase
MGLNFHGVKFLLHARKKGVSFEKTAMIGRQTIMTDAAELRRCFQNFGLRLSDAELEEISAATFAEPLLKRIGAREVVSFDISDFEKPTYTHDFNLPIPDKFKNKFSVVLDGGSLEHIFNFPTAIKNCMEMIVEGGHFLSLTPANNHMGHGFYQFSPELFFRLFNASNGFFTEQILIYEESGNTTWFEVADPDTVKERVTLVNDQPSLMLIIAKKIKTVEVLKEFPQQSDYVARWHAGQGDDTRQVNGNRLPRGLTLNRILGAPFSVLRRVQTKISHRFGMLNRRAEHFKKINPS